MEDFQRSILYYKKYGKIVRRRTATTYLPNIVTLDVIKLFKDIIHDSNNDVSIYKQVTIKEVRGVLGYGREVLTKRMVLESTGMSEDKIKKLLANEEV